MALNEANTCRAYVTPSLREVGWETLPCPITEQHTFTDGRVEFNGNKTKRDGEQKRADYPLLATIPLRFTRDHPIAVGEAKPA